MAGDPSSLRTSSHPSEGKINEKYPARAETHLCVCVCEIMAIVGVCRASRNRVPFRGVDTVCVLQQELTYAELRLRDQDQP